MVLDFKGVHFPKTVIRHAVFSVTAMLARIVTRRRTWLSGASALTTRR